MWKTKMKKGWGKKGIKTNEKNVLRHERECDVRDGIKGHPKMMTMNKEMKKRMSKKRDMEKAEEYKENEQEIKSKKVNCLNKLDTLISKCPFNHFTVSKTIKFLKQKMWLKLKET